MSIVNKITKLDRSSKNAFFAALIVIMTIAMYSWIVAPHATYMSAAEQYESVIENTAKQNIIVESKLQIKKKKIEQLNKKLIPLKAVLFTSEESQNFFGTHLQIILEETGCAANSLDFISSKTVSRDKKEKSNISGIVLKRATLNVTGLYGSVVKLMEMLQENTKKVWIESVAVKPFSEDSSQISCDMTISIYTIQDKETSVNE
ncbi:MAG: hypothetical protein KAS75_02225 [Planctomycetes bacterium]|nr:hypothetical protein [Planctomycetota bacterium]